MTGCACSGDFNNNCGNWLDNLVLSQWEEVGQSAGQSLAFTSGYFLASNNVGKINNSLDTCYQVVCLTGVSGVITGRSICPEMNSAVQGIYSYLYQYDFYNNQARWALSGVGGVGGLGIHSIKEWNRSITFGGTRVEIARAFRDLAKEAKAAYDKSVLYYLKFGSMPAMVEGNDFIPGYNYGAYGGQWGGPGGFNNPRNYPSY